MLKLLLLNYLSQRSILNERSLQSVIPVLFISISIKLFFHSVTDLKNYVKKNILYLRLNDYKNVEVYFRLHY